MESSLYLVLILLFAGLISSADVSKRRNNRIDLEIVSVTPNSVVAKFSPYKDVKAYYVSIKFKNAVGSMVSPEFYTTIKQSDMHEDGLYYINSDKTLLPGQEYEIDIFNDRKNTLFGSAIFTTKCDEYSFECNGVGGEFATLCVPSYELCDGIEVCSDGSDELTNDDGTCANTRPPRPGSVGIPSLEKKNSGWSEILDNLWDWAG